MRAALSSADGGDRGEALGLGGGIAASKKTRATRLKRRPNRAPVYETTETSTRNGSAGDNLHDGHRALPRRRLQRKHTPAPAASPGPGCRSRKYPSRQSHVQCANSGFLVGFSGHSSSSQRGSRLPKSQARKPTRPPHSGSSRPSCAGSACGTVKTEVAASIMNTVAGPSGAAIKPSTAGKTSYVGGTPSAASNPAGAKAAATTATPTTANAEPARLTSFDRRVRLFSQTVVAA